MTAKHRERAKRMLRPTLVGIGSLLDLNGIATYNRARRMQPIRRESLSESAMKVTKMMTLTSNERRPLS